MIAVNCRGYPEELLANENVVRGASGLSPLDLTPQADKQDHAEKNNDATDRASQSEKEAREARSAMPQAKQARSVVEQARSVDRQGQQARQQARWVMDQARRADLLVGEQARRAELLLGKRAANLDPPGRRGVLKKGDMEGAQASAVKADMEVSTSTMSRADKLRLWTRVRARRTRARPRRLRRRGATRSSASTWPISSSGPLYRRCGDQQRFYSDCMGAFDFTSQALCFFRHHFFR